MAHKPRRSKRRNAKGSPGEGRLQRRASWAVIGGFPIAVATLAVGIVALSDDNGRAVVRKVHLEDVGLTMYNPASGERVRGATRAPEIE